jgi:hypothetical protein
MKPPTESPPNLQKEAGTALGPPKPKPVIDPPTQPFIIVDGDGPGDPSKFQRFIVPLEFIQKANAVELPRLNPDDFKDTVPPNQLLMAPAGLPQSSPEEKTPEPSGPVHTALQDTVIVPKRRKSAPISKELLASATTVESKSILKHKVLWLLGSALVVLILLLVHLQGGRAEQSIPSASTALPAAISGSRLTTEKLPLTPTGAATPAQGSSSVASEAHSNPTAEFTHIHKARVDAVPPAPLNPLRRQRLETPQLSVTPATTATPSSTSATTRPPKVFWQQQPE